MDLFDTLAAVTTNTPPQRVFSLCWNLSFRGPQSTVSMGFSRAPIEKIPSSLNEERRLTRIISNDDNFFNYFIKIKDYIVKRTRSLVAETFSIAYAKVFRLFIYLIVENTWAVDDELPTSINSKKRKISHGQGTKFPQNGGCFRKRILKPADLLIILHVIEKQTRKQGGGGGGGVRRLRSHPPSFLLPPTPPTEVFSLISDLKQSEVGILFYSYLLIV